VSATIAADQASYYVTLAPDSGADYPRMLRDDVEHALDAGSRSIVIDCGVWRRLDLRLLSALVRCARSCAACDAGFELVNLAAHLRADLRELRLDARVGIQS
jgi:hypothetical protein